MIPSYETWNSSIEALPKGFAGDFKVQNNEIVRFGTHLPIGFPWLQLAREWMAKWRFPSRAGNWKRFGIQTQTPRARCRLECKPCWDIEKKVVSGRINPLSMRQDQDHQLLGCFKCPTVVPRFWNSWKMPFISLSYSHFFVNYVYIYNPIPLIWNTLFETMGFAGQFHMVGTKVSSPWRLHRGCGVLRCQILWHLTPRGRAMMLPGFLLFFDPEPCHPRNQWPFQEPNLEVPSIYYI